MWQSAAIFPPFSFAPIFHARLAPERSAVGLASPGVRDWCVNPFSHQRFAGRASSIVGSAPRYSEHPFPRAHVPKRPDADPDTQSVGVPAGGARTGVWVFGFAFCI